MSKRGPKPKSPRDRFMAKVEKRGCCWAWTGAWGKSAFRMDAGAGRHQGGWKAHPRLAAAVLFRGAAPTIGISWFPTCGNERCVNPDHLVECAPSHAPSRFDPDAYPCGHPRTEENTYHCGESNVCKVCQNVRTRAWRAANPERSREIQRRSNRTYYLKKKRERESA